MAVAVSMDSFSVSFKLSLVILLFASVGSTYGTLYVVGLFRQDIVTGILAGTISVAVTSLVGYYLSGGRLSNFCLSSTSVPAEKSSTSGVLSSLTSVVVVPVETDGEPQQQQQPAYDDVEGATFQRLVMDPDERALRVASKESGKMGKMVMCEVTDEDLATTGGELSTEDDQNDESESKREASPV
jgi:hypothetical protein